jgi:hypothetical protein
MAYYSNKWYVERQQGGDWKIDHASVGTKAYAMGYLNALDSMQPHPPYRLIDKTGQVSETRPAREAMKTT